MKVDCPKLVHSAACCSPLHYAVVQDLEGGCDAESADASDEAEADLAVTAAGTSNDPFEVWSLDSQGLHSAIAVAVLHTPFACCVLS